MFNFVSLLKDVIWRLYFHKLDKIKVITEV